VPIPQAAMLMQTGTIIQVLRGNLSFLIDIVVTSCGRNSNTHSALKSGFCGC